MRHKFNVDHLFQSISTLCVCYPLYIGNGYRKSVIIIIKRLDPDWWTGAASPSAERSCAVATATRLILRCIVTCPAQYAAAENLNDNGGG